MLGLVVNICVPISASLKVTNTWDIQARAKWDAWEQEKGKDMSRAEQEYIEMASKLVDEYGVAC